MAHADKLVSTTKTPLKISKHSISSRAVVFLRLWGTLIVIAATMIGFSIASPYFLTVSNINNILFSMIVSCLVSVGLTFVVVGGSFDLSVGMTVTTASIVTAALIPLVGPWAAIVGGLLLGAFVGLVNGFLVTYGRLSGIVVTLGTMFVLGGVNMFLTDGYQIAVDYGQTAFLFIGQGKLGAVAFPVVVLLAVVTVMHFVSTRTKPGHYISAVGDNAVAAYYSGVKVYFWVILAFIFAGLMSSIAGIILTSVSTSAQPVGGEGYLLEAFAAVFLGATVLGKGKPHVFGTVMGVFFIYVANSGMSMVGFPFAARQLFSGMILIIAVGANALLNREELHLKFI